MMQARLAVLVLSLASIVATAASAAESRTAVTVYTRDLGFVREQRTLEIGGTRDTLRLGDIPERIDVASVRLDLEPGRVTRLAYRYDVASGDDLLLRARGARVRVALRGDRVVEGTLVGSDGSWLVVRETDGAVRTLSRTAVEDARIMGGPERLFTRPMLEAVVEGGRKGSVPARLTYLTGGLTWAAEHTLVRSGETAGSWSSAVTVDNQTGRDFADVALSLVAGEPKRELPSPMPMGYRGAPVLAMSAEKAVDLSEQSFSEYHLYTLDRPATLRDRETQKLTMLEPRDVKLAPRYLFRGAEGRGVHAQIEVVNSAASGLGVPIAGGRVRFYEPDAGGELHFAGETSVLHTAEGEKLALDVGQAFDLVAERRETSSRRISDREREYSVEIKLRNRKKVAATFEIEEPTSGDIDILQKSHDFTRKDANTLLFRIPLAAGKETVVSYTARVRY